MTQPSATDDNSRVFGYAQSSRAGNRVITKIASDYVQPEHPNEPSVKRQIADLEKWAEQRGKPITIGFDEGISGAEVSYKQRPGFQGLVKQMQKGDRLVVWRLDRLDRGLGRMIEAAVWLVEEKGYFLHTLYEQSGDALNLGTTEGKILLHVYSMLATIDNDGRRAAIKAGLDYCRNVGLKYCSHPGYGRRFETAMEHGKPVLNRHKKPLQLIVWDEHECDVIREIIRRRDKDHESWYRIGRELHERRERSPDGKPWLTWSKHTIRTGDQGNPYRVKKVYAWYKAPSAHGMDLGEPGVPAGIHSLAKQFNVSVETVKAYITPTSQETLKRNQTQPQPKFTRRQRRAQGRRQRLTEEEKEMNAIEEAIAKKAIADEDEEPWVPVPWPDHMPKPEKDRSQAGL